MLRNKKWIGLLLVLVLLLQGCSGRGKESSSLAPSDNSTSSQTEQSSSLQEESMASQEESSLKSSEKEVGAIIKTPTSKEEKAGEGDDALILVNGSHVLEKEMDIELMMVADPYRMEKTAGEAMLSMLAAAKKDGVSLNIISAYRPFSSSERLYNAKVKEYENSGYKKEDALVEAAKWVAPPGKSEHNTGLAADIVSPDYFNKYDDLYDKFEEFPAFDWLYENCATYGFILRYPKDKEAITGITYEPWHYRYVGVEHAKKIMAEKICLEEYLDK